MNLVVYTMKHGERQKQREKDHAERSEQRMTDSPLDQAA